MKKIIALFLAMIFVAGALTSCVGEGAGEKEPTKITLTKDNISEYLNVYVVYENFSCTRKSNTIIGGYYVVKADAVIKVSPKNSNHEFNVKFGVYAYGPGTTYVDKDIEYTGNTAHEAYYHIEENSLSICTNIGRATAILSDVEGYVIVKE